MGSSLRQCPHEGHFHFIVLPGFKSREQGSSQGDYHLKW